jgi:D-alanine-D-alanine ligase-like ATP-grasp enzyme
VNKKVLAFCFGGKSAEHDVSIITGLQAMDNTDKQKYEIIPLYLSREGVFYTGEKLRDMAFITWAVLFARADQSARLSTASSGSRH